MMSAWSFSEFSLGLHGLTPSCSKLVAAAAEANDKAVADCENFMAADSGCVLAAAIEKQGPGHAR